MICIFVWKISFLYIHVYSVYIISEKDIINKFCLEFHINTYAHACDQSNNRVMCLHVNTIKTNWYTIWNKVAKSVGSMAYLNLNEILFSNHDVIWNWLPLTVIHVIPLEKTTTMAKI